MRAINALALAAAAAAFALPGGALAQRHPVQKPVYTLAWTLKCVVSGTPSEFPDDIALINNGPGAVPAGAKIHWSMYQNSGNYTFTAALAKGGLVRISGVLPGGVEAGKACAVAKLP